MAPRTASASSTARRRAAPATQSTNAEAGPSRLPALTERRVVNHINRLRELPSLTGFDAYVDSTANDWMDAMYQQAVNIRQAWATEYEADQSSGIQAKMAGEMLKTPARKKATATLVKARGRTVSKQVANKDTAKASADPFPEPENKENTPVAPEGTSAKAHSSTAAPRNRANPNTSITARSTRSRAEQEPPKLPNPFQAKLLQAKSKAAPRTVPEKKQPTPPAANDEEPVAAPTPSAKHEEPSNAEPPTDSTPLKPPQPPPTAVGSRLRHLAVGEDSMEVENTLTEVPTFDTEPKASTPTGSKTSLNRIAFGGLPAIGDPQLYSSSEAEATDDEDGAAESEAESEGRVQPSDDADAAGQTPTKQQSDRGDDQEEATQHVSSDVESTRDATKVDDDIDDEATAVLDELIDSSLAPPPPSSPPPQERACSQPSAEEETTLPEETAQQPAPASPAPAQRTKRTLNSFGGTKKSLGYTLQTHAASTPANAGFKSSFLNKSLRKASMAAKDQDGEDNAGDAGVEGSFDLSLPTRANTQANAAGALPGPTRPDVAASSQEPPHPSRVSAGIKRKSDEPEHQAPQTAKQSKQTAKTNVKPVQAPSQPAVRPDLSRASSQQSEAGNQNAQLSRMPSSNLLRSKLESARQQRTANMGGIGLGLGSKVITSPLLNRSQFSPPPAPASPEIAKGLQSMLSPPGKKGGNVSELLDRWEAKSNNNSARSSPRKSLVKKTSPSKLPVPVSSTPTGSPGPKALYKGTVPQQQHARATPEEPEEDTSSQEDPAASESAVTAKEDIQDAPATDKQQTSKRHSLDDLDDGELSDQKEEEDADDEDGEDEEDQPTTKIARPLSQGREAVEKTTPALSQQRERSVSAGEFYSGDESQDEEEPAANAEDAAKASTVAAAKKPQDDAAAPTPAAAQNATSVPWISRLKGAFMPSVGGGGVGMGPAPGSGFQPNKNRIATNSSTASTVSSSSAGSRVVTGTELAQQPKPAAATARAPVATGKLTSLAAQKAKAEENKESEKKRRVREDEDKTGPLGDRTGPQRPPTAQGSRVTSNASTASSSSSVASNSAASRARVVSHFGQASGASGSQAKLKAPAPKPVVSRQSVTTANGKKRRLTNEIDERASPVSVKTMPGSAIKASGTMGKTASAASKVPGKVGASGTVRPGVGPASTTNMWSAKATTTAGKQGSVAKTVAGASSSVRPPAGGLSVPQRPGPATQTSQAGNFSQANPFQQARVPGTPAANGKNIASKTPRSGAPLQHPRVASFASPNIDDDNMSLPSIASEYSDSEDEATQARRARAAPWTKGQALATALRNQQTMDTDEIFGVPRGTVDLNVLMPPRDADAHKRIFRPRSSSANWSGPDGLAQWEIQRYNERMNIQSGGAGGSGAGRQ